MNPNLPFCIRRMEVVDIPIIVDLERQVFTDPWPESAYTQELYFNPQAHYFALQLTDPQLIRQWQPWKPARQARLMGYVGTRTELNKSHISTLAVHPDWRGQRFGALLLLTALAQAIEDQTIAITLEVRVSNIIAQSLYVKYGFSNMMRLQGYYDDGEDAFLMRVSPLDAAYAQFIKQHQTTLLTHFKFHPLRVR